jgi:hypothetical protein
MPGGSRLSEATWLETETDRLPIDGTARQRGPAMRFNAGRWLDGRVAPAQGEARRILNAGEGVVTDVESRSI